jgi:hypothetical protein
VRNIFLSSCGYRSDNVRNETGLATLNFRYTPIRWSFVSSFYAPASLTSLDLYHSHVDEIDLYTLLSSAHTFSLKTLRIAHLRRANIDCSPYTPAISAELLARLDRLSLDTHDYHSDSVPPPPVSEKVLWSFSQSEIDAKHLIQFAPRHLVLDDLETKINWSIPWTERCVWIATTVLQSPLVLLRPEAPILQSIWIPSIFEPDWQYPSVVVEAFEQLQDAAGEVGTDLCWYSGDEFEEFGRYLQKKGTGARMSTSRSE